jgi:beta-galactosidase
MIGRYADEAGVTLRTDVTPGTIVAPRQGDGCRVWVVVNMDGAGGTVTVPQRCFDMLAQRPVEPGPLAVGRYEYRVLRFQET